MVHLDPTSDLGFLVMAEQEDYDALGGSICGARFERDDNDTFYAVIGSPDDTDARTAELWDAAVDEIDAADLEWLEFGDESAE